ncbi:MAG: PASTA domain-containing protein [Oscillospiraceae bacterium]|nr:PASTA domain-containing protein [Oscillospiraceae bacterium]
MKKNERLYKAFENMPDEYIESAFENKPFETADTNTKSDELTEICTVEVYQHKRNWKIIAAATAACLVIGTVSSVVYKNNKYGVPADNPEITDCTVTENSGHYESDGASVSKYMLKTVQPFPDSDYCFYSSGNIYTRLNSGNDFFCILNYYDYDKQEDVSVEFISSMEISEEYLGAEISDYYVSDDGYLYYCGSLLTDGKSDRSGIAGRFSLNTQESECVKIYSDMVCENIFIAEGTDELYLEDKENQRYILDSNLEITSAVSPDTVVECKRTDCSEVVEIDNPYILNKVYEFNNTMYTVGVLNNFDKIYKTSLSGDNTETIYCPKDNTVITAGGDVMALYTYKNENFSHLMKCTNTIPQLKGKQIPGYYSLVNGSENLLLNYFDYSEEKDRYCIYSPEGEKLYDFDYPDEYMEYIYNDKDETGEKVYFLDYKNNKVTCYEPETDTVSELTALNEKVDFSERAMFPYEGLRNIYRDEKFDFQIFKNDSMYGYNIENDEMVLIIDNLDSYGINFSSFTVAENGTIYCTSNGSNLYELIPVTENAGQTDNSENLFVIPELQNTTIDEALKIFDDAGINTMVKMCYSDTIPESEVIKTEPSAGTAIDKKSTVTIWGSRGTMRIMARMPDIGSKSITDAEKILTGIDMLPEIVEVYDSDLPEGTVISFDPEPGTFVETGTTIVLNVSTKNSTRTKTEYEVTEISDNDFGAEEEPETCNLLIRDNDGNQRWIRVFDSYVNKNSIDVGSKIEFYY